MSRSGKGRSPGHFRLHLAMHSVAHGVFKGVMKRRKIPEGEKEGEAGFGRDMPMQLLMIEGRVRVEWRRECFRVRENERGL